MPQRYNGSRTPYRSPRRAPAPPPAHGRPPARGGYPPPAPHGGDWYAMRRRRRRKRRVHAGVLVALAGVALAVAALLLYGRQPEPADPVREAPLPAAATPTPDPRPVVAIDPGHGGVDRGSEGPGWGEYEMTWKTANALYDLLERDGRLRPFLTISEQESQNPDSERVMPSERARRAGEAGAALLLSIHGNSDPVYGASGYECYAILTGRPHHEESLRFARMLAGSFSELGQRLRGVDGVRYIYYDDDNNKVVVESTDTTVYDDPTFGVLEYAACPAVLSEQCFITNAADVDLLADEDGVLRAAQLYYDDICEWFGLEPQASAGV